MSSYSFKIGDFICRSIMDGSFAIHHEEIFPGAPADEIIALLKKHGLEPGEVPIGLSCLLVNTGKDMVLVDTGFGPDFAPNVGKLMANLDAEGIKPSDITTIFISHGHMDHIGGYTNKEGKLAFPKARCVMSQTEWDFWTNEENLTTLREDSFKQAQINNVHKNFLPSIDCIDITEQGTEIMPGFKAFKSPGHTPGHVSLFRENDRALIAGDAFVTVKQDSLFKVLMQQKEITGPPVYYTTDWNTSWQSVKKLEALKPSVAITGHGLPMSGDELQTNLSKLANEFKKLAIPSFGRYIH